MRVLSFTPEELAELVNSRQLRSRIRNVVLDELRAMAPTLQPQPATHYVMKLVPPGWWTTEQAVLELRKAHPIATHFSTRLMDYYVSKRKIEGGNGFVLASSMLAFIKKYNPRVGAARSRGIRKALNPEP